MTLRHLEVFMAVCRTMSMTKAAEDLNMTQPAVSKAIAELESFYRTSLFDRLNRKLYLTDAGESLREYADSILSQFDESIAFLRDGNSFQTCRLSVNVTVGESILSGLIAAISRQLPQLRLSVNVHNSYHIEQMLRNNDCDLGIIDEKDDLLFDTVHLYEEELGFFAALSDPLPEKLSLKELGACRLLIREKGSGNRAAADKFLQKTDSAPLLWESSSNAALKKLAQNGMGIAVLPLSSVQKEDQLRRIRIPGASLKRQFYLVSLRNKYLNPMTCRCMEVIREYCRKTHEIH